MFFWLFYPLPFFLYIILLAVLTHIPTLPKLPIDFNNIDKLEHLTAYAILTFLLFRWVKKINKERYFRTFFFLLLLYAGLDEFFQLFVPGRTASIFDFFADFIGISIIFFIYKRVLKNENSPS